MRALTGEDARRPVWPFAIPAVLISVAWSAISAAATARHSPPAHDASASGIAGEIFYTLGVIAVPVVLVWTAFFVFALGRRSLGKSFWVLAFMASFSFAAALPARLASISGMPIADVGRAIVWTQEVREGFQARFDVFAADVPASTLRAALTEPTPDIEAVNLRLEQIGTLKGKVAAYLTELSVETGRAYQSLTELDISERTRAQRRGWLDAQLAETSQLRQLPALILRLLEKREEMLLLLRDRPEAWTTHNGQIAILDAALLERLSALNVEFAELDAQFRAVAAGAGTGRAPM